MLPASLLKQCGPYYHLTSTKNWELIEKEGLDPSKCDAMGPTYPGIVGRYVCLSTRFKPDGYVDALRNGLLIGEKTVFLEVATDAVAKRRVDLDYTFQDNLSELQKELGTEDPLEFIKRGHPVVCYDVIPPGALKVVGEYDAIERLVD
jgi:hypothetical protein